MEVIPAYDQLQQDFKAMEDDTTYLQSVVLRLMQPIS